MQKTFKQVSYIPLDSVGIYKFWVGPMQDKGNDRENILHFSDKKNTERSPEKIVRALDYFTVTFFHRKEQSKST